IARRLRELGVYAEVVDGQAPKPPADFTFHGVILSGGPDSVGEEGSRRIPSWVTSAGKPILGICYGMQLLVEHFGGKVRSGDSREYGRARLDLHKEISSVGSPGAKVLQGLPLEQIVWMSHGDDIESLPADMQTIARTSDGVLGAVVHRELPVIGLQFHPEVH